MAGMLGSIVTAVDQSIMAKDTANIADYNAANVRRTSVYNAAVAEQAAGQEEAASQLRAQEAKRQSDFQASRVLALVGVSGGNAMDIDVMNILAGFEEEGDLASRTELYAGSDKASNLRAKGAAGIWKGESDARSIQYEGLSKSGAMKRKATGTIVDGVVSMATKYGSMMI